MRVRAVTGAILGTAIGDAIGLPYEALSFRRASKLLGAPDRHRLFLGRGLCSDDTEHTCLAAQSLCASAGEPDEFRRDLARRLRWWLLGLPAGIGFATLRATCKLWLGFPPSRSGVFSAGNGPAMRSAVLGAAVRDTGLLARLVRESSRITHTDPKAYAGALAVALAAGLAAEGVHDGRRVVAELRALPRDDGIEECESLIERAAESAARGESTQAFAAQFGVSGVSGYVFHTVPVAIHAWLSCPRDFRRAVQSAVLCGGDTDTVAAIVGGIVGAGVGAEGIPPDWLSGLREWPRGEAWMRELAAATARSIETRERGQPPRVSPLKVLARNAVFTAIVLGHVARRALPPY